VPDKCYAPKKLLHTWVGHTKGVNAIRFFPKTGHLLLSCSMDKTVKIWSTEGQRRCLRTYIGHDQAVRDICFTKDGRRFVSCSYDKYIKLWDTETGQCISRHTNKRIPYCAVLHPERDNEMLCGMSNKVIVQWDLRENRIVQTYNEHLGPVNRVLFIKNNTQFVSASDDKMIFVWDYGTPVVHKRIGDPESHSTPALALHPSGKYFIAQSQDNQVLLFDCWNTVKLNRKRRFIGHLTAGYACEVGFSPDGSIVCSGDAEGRAFFWSWKKGIIYKKLKCHDQVTIGCAFHPLETSRVATCSWDGTIKYWD